jgi:glycosyltransferase involved in cell wall biosynthesis
MERMSERGHEILVIDYEILWRRHNRERTCSSRQVFHQVRKATESGHVTLVRPSVLKLPVLEYLSLLYTHDKEIGRQIKVFSPDVVVCLGILNAALAIKHARIEKKPLVYYVIDELHRLVLQPGFQSLARRVEVHNMRRADLVISINEALRDYTIALGAEPDRTMTISSGVDTSRFNPKLKSPEIRKEFGFQFDDTVVFFMGWLYGFSGLKEIVQELIDNPDKYENLKLMIIGEGESWDSLSKLVARDSENRVILLGWKPYEDIPKYLAASDVCILPALRHGVMENIVPIKMYEYMAMGKPVVSTYLPGIVREFGHKNGITYAIGANDILNKIKELVSEGRIVEEGQKAADYMSRRDWNTVAAGFEGVLNAVVRQRDRAYNRARIHCLIG